MAESIGALLVKVGADVSDLIDGFNKADKAVDKFTRTIDRRLLDPLAKIAGAAAAAGAGIFAMTKSAADTVDQIGKMAQRVGMTVEALSGLKYAAELSDVSLQDLGQGLKQLSKYMVENHLEGSTVEEQMLRIADEFAATADGAGKTAAAMKYFGKAGADLIPLLNQGRAGIEELRKEASKLGIVFSSEAAARAEEFNDNLTRLKANSQAAQIALAGPFVKALNETAKAYLKANEEGAGYLETLSEIIFKATMGTDLGLLERDIFKTTEALEVLRNEADMWRRGGSKGLDPFGIRMKETQAQIAETEKRLRMLIAKRHEFFDTKEKKKEDEKKKPQFEMPGDPKLGEALQEGLDEQARVAAESAQIADDARARERDQARKARALDLQETDDWSHMNIDLLYQNYQDRMKVLMEAADAEEALAIATGEATVEADGESHSLKIEALRQSMLTEEQMLNEQHAKRLEQLDQFTDDELAALGGRHAVIERMTEEHEERMSRIRTNHSSLSLNSAKTFFGSLAVLMNTHSRKAFEIGKAAAIAETVINTHAAAMAAYKAMAGIPVVGPALGAAAAAAAVVAGVAQIQAIRSQTMSGGSGAAPTFAANASTGQPIGTPGGDVGTTSRARGPDTTVHLHGQFFDRKSVRALLELFSEESRDGGRVVLAGAS